MFGCCEPPTPEGLTAVGILARQAGYARFTWTDPADQYRLFSGFYTEFTYVEPNRPGTGSKSRYTGGLDPITKEIAPTLIQNDPNWTIRTGPTVRTFFDSITPTSLSGSIWLTAGFTDFTKVIHLYDFFSDITGPLVDPWERALGALGSVPFDDSYLTLEKTFRLNPDDSLVETAFGTIAATWARLDNDYSSFSRTPPYPAGTYERSGGITLWTNSGSTFVAQPIFNILATKARSRNTTQWGRVRDLLNLREDPFFRNTQILACNGNIPPGTTITIAPPIAAPIFERHRIALNYYPEQQSDPCALP